MSLFSDQWRIYVYTETKYFLFSIDIIMVTSITRNLFTCFLVHHVNYVGDTVTGTEQLHGRILKPGVAAIATTAT